MFKQDFPFFSDHDTIYLDNAATTQKPHVVLDAMHGYYVDYCANTHRGAHELGNEATRHYEQARATIADYLGAQTEEIIFTRGTTEAINLVASTYVKQHFKTVIISAMEHHANIVPWQLAGLTIQVIPLNDDLSIDLDAYVHLLKENPESFVALSHVSNVFGLINPIEKMIGLAHEHGCSVLIDGAQALAHLPIDLRALNADFYAVSAHKAYGPTGIGVLYGKSALLEKMPPYQGGGSMIDDVSFEKATFLPPPLRFEAGTQSIAEAIGFGAAIDYLKAHREQALTHDKTLLASAREHLLDINDMILYTQADTVCGNISFNVKGIHHDDLAILLSKQNIMLRSGHHCALPLMKLLKINGTLRLSFALYNELSDIEKCVHALHKAIRMLR